MKNIIIFLFFVGILSASIFASKLARTTKLGDKIMYSRFENGVSLTQTQVHDLNFVVKPNFDYYIVYQLQRYRKKEGLFSYSIKTDTISRSDVYEKYVDPNK